MKHGIGYCRCSTVRQEKSIPEQKAAITAWAERNGCDPEPTDTGGQACGEDPRQRLGAHECMYRGGGSDPPCRVGS